MFSPFSLVLLCLFNENYTLLAFWNGCIWFFAFNPPRQPKQVRQETAGASAADSSMLTLIKLQSIWAECQETLGSSAI